MLKIYKNIFKELKKNNIKCILYKSLNFIEEDLKGNRGDLDILIEEKNIKLFEDIIFKHGFKKVLKNEYPFYYFGYDNETGKLAFLDIDIKIRLGHKPFRPYNYKIDINKLQTRIIKDCIYVLKNNDYVPLMLLMRITSKYPKKIDYNEIKFIEKKQKTKDNSYINDILEKLTKTKKSIIKKELINGNSWLVLQKKYKKIILKQSNLLYYQKFKEYFIKFIIYKNIFKNLIGFPKYRIRKKGFMVSFIGVDGAGKTSTINKICSIEYFKLTGIKEIYFGNNNYWIPYIVNIHNKYKKNKIIFLITHTLMRIDRQLRILKAIYYIYTGNIVIADRFYYDDYIGEIMRKQKKGYKKNFFKELYYSIFKIRIYREPEISIFMDVSPEIAYKRKQDYSYEIMKKNNQIYKKYMYSLPNTIAINCDEKQDKVINKIIKKILKLQKNI